ncbi:MAG: hypothetical protein ACXWUG_14875 [Polyangiales bacterium]
MNASLRLASVFAFALTAGACAVPADNGAAADDSVDEGALDAELTSNTALSRKLTFQGKVYVSATAGDYEITRAVKKQTQSAFGALREANVGVATRELSNVDASTFAKRKVVVVGTDGSRTPMQEVRYTYNDAAVVPKTMARRSSISLGLLNGYYASQSGRILTECTDNDSHAREFESSIWYVFNPSLATCKKAMTAEQKAIDTARAKLADPKNDVVQAEVDRLYLPMTAKLAASTTNTKPSYPEYDRLYAGGVEPGKLVIGMVSGMMADWAAGEKHDTIDDEGYKMWFEGVQAVFAARTNFKLVSIEGTKDLTVTVGGKTYSPSFTDVMNWELSSTGFPTGLSTTDRRALRVAVGDKLAKHWIRFEAPVSVSVGGETKDVTIVLQTYFGAEGDSTPHKRAIKTSDVFIYNGHSYIGYGPLDPSNFSAADFPSSYQIMFVNGCVSYNYYDKDYVPLKSGGTRNLDTVTNGLESWVNGSGPAMGRFVGALIDGKQHSYSELLTAAQFTGYGYSWGQDALRVVEGELDNLYSPAKKPITVSPR